MKLSYLLFATTLSFIFLPSLPAETLSKWDFTGAKGNELEAEPIKDSVPSSLRVSSLIRGEGLTLPKAVSFTENSFSVRIPPEVLTAEEAVHNSAFIEVTLTPSPEKKLTIDRIIFSSKRATKKSGPLLLIVRSSLDNYTSDIAGPLAIVPNDAANGADLEIPLGATLPGISRPITIRLYPYGRSESNNPSSGSWVLANSESTGGFSIEGSIAP